MKNFIFLPVTLIILFTCDYLRAQSLVAPVDVKNMHILYISHLFMPVESPRVSEYGSNSIAAAVIISNTNFMFEQNGKTGNFDIETKCFMLTYTRKITDNIEFRAALPYYYNSGGFMDSFIEGFHKALPFTVRNGGREFVNDDEIHVWYMKDEGGVDINSSFYGAGDPSFFIKKIFHYDDFGLAASLGIKPWTGSSRFIKSGTTDMGATLSMEYSPWILNFSAMAGFTYFMGEGTYKEELEQERDWMILFAACAGIRIGDSVYAAVQFYCNTSPYVTGVTRIDNITVLNSYAIRWQPWENMIFQFSFDEDTFTYVTTDIAFSLRCMYIF